MRYGRDRAAAKVLDVAEDEAEEGRFAVVGDAGVADIPIAPEML